MPKQVECNLCGSKTTLPMKEHQASDNCKLDVFYSETDSESETEYGSDSSSSSYYYPVSQSDGESSIDSDSDDELLGL